MAHAASLAHPAAAPDAPSGAALTSLLEQLDLIRAPARAPSVIEGLGRWLGWAEAGPLFEALNTPVPVAAALPGDALTLAEQDLAQVRQWLSRAVAAEPLTRRGAPLPDVAECRQRYAALQHQMAQALSALRQRLRAHLAAAGGDAARLAAVDALLARVVEARESLILAALPALLERRAEQRCPSGADPDLPGLHADMRELLQAELALRLQPLLGLLEALRARAPEPQPARAPEPQRARAPDTESPTR
ncbi:DUF3348 family protein [Ideonella sp. 4Y16]|uniref:DUF3348 family protein n=1 Tax=Ideonella alba TaxID=2824118 RepID=UPI001B393DA1|nr:DUF3348 family protein [Ideonella alba]MBQ0944308.1 DUF3348 family protein [Ideonella alba]